MAEQEDVSKKNDNLSDEKSIKIHNFSASVFEDLVHFHVMQMQGSLFVWIGRKPELNNLAVAMCTKYEPIPAVTRLMGEVSDITSDTLAQKLARKSKKQCFVSYNLPSENALLQLVERRLIKEMDDKPNLF